MDSVVALERELLDPACRVDSDRVATLLANDFVEIGLLRGALHKAVEAAGLGGLRHESLTQKVFDALGLPFHLYSRDADLMGNARRDALKAMAERTQVGDVQTFVNALIQAEAMGVSLAQVIRVQADQMRMRRRQRAEEQAHKAPVKITIPLVLFFFPTILIVILGPAGLRLSEILGSGE